MFRTIIKQCQFGFFTRCIPLTVLLWPLALRSSWYSYYHPGSELTLILAIPFLLLKEDGRQSLRDLGFKLLRFFFQISGNNFFFSFVIITSRHAFPISSNNGCSCNVRNPSIFGILRFGIFLSELTLRDCFVLSWALGDNSWPAKRVNCPVCRWQSTFFAHSLPDIYYQQMDLIPKFFDILCLHNFRA